MTIIGWSIILIVDYPDISSYKYRAVAVSKLFNWNKVIIVVPRLRASNKKEKV